MSVISRPTQPGQTRLASQVEIPLEYDPLRTPKGGIALTTGAYSLFVKSYLRDDGGQAQIDSFRVEFAALASEAWETLLSGGSVTEGSRERLRTLRALGDTLHHLVALHLLTGYSFTEQVRRQLPLAPLHHTIPPRDGLCVHANALRRFLATPKPYYAGRSVYEETLDGLLGNAVAHFLDLLWYLNFTLTEVMESSAAGDRR